MMAMATAMIPAGISTFIIDLKSLICFGTLLNNNALVSMTAILDISEGCSWIGPIFNQRADPIGALSDCKYCKAHKK